jgi:hypothetical protein
MVAHRWPIRADLANLTVLSNKLKHNWPKQKKMSEDNHEMLVIAGSTSEKENEQKQENN